MELEVGTSGRSRIGSAQNEATRAYRRIEQE